MLFVQLRGTIILRVSLKEHCYGDEGPGEDLGLAGGTHKKDDSFLSRWRTARNGRKKKILFAVP